MISIAPLQDLAPARFETPALLKAVALASRKLAELKGVAASIPNQGVLINALGLQEAKDTAGKYLDELADRGFLEKRRVGRANYYINLELTRILTEAERPSG